MIISSSCFLSKCFLSFKFVFSFVFFPFAFSPRTRSVTNFLKTNCVERQLERVNGRGDSLWKVVISEATFSAWAWHGRALPEPKHTQAKASRAGPFQTAWVAACPLSFPYPMGMARVTVTQHCDCFFLCPVRS